ncbi:hypothetical protein PG984_006757 [Apiospora sp. TS-2023a]
MKPSHLLPTSLAAAAAVPEGEWHPPNLTDESVKSILLESGTCCAALSRVLWDQVSYPGQQPFESSLASYWSVLEREVSPRCVVIPNTKSDVAKAIFVLRTGDELFPEQCNFAVRSGGHTPFASSANIESGITIDLSKLKHVDVSADRTSVNIGPGNRWGDVYSILDEQGLSTSGSRVASVGVGGLVTGGGMSFFSPRYGYVCDNVEGLLIDDEQNFEVVLTSGEIANANATSHPDLWRSLKGGSNNFGVVTSLNMRTFPQGKLWGGFLVVDIATIEQQFAAFEALLGSPDYDPYASLIFSLFWDAASDVWATSYGMHYTKPVENPPAFRNFTSLPQLFGTMRISNLTDFAVEMAAANPSDHRDLFVTATCKNSAEMMAAIYRIVQTVVAPLRSVPNIRWSISMQPQPSMLNRKSAATGGNAFGLDGDDNLFNVLLTATWDRPEDDALVNRQARSLLDQCAAAARDLGVDHPYIYLNYAGPGQDAIVAGYGAASVARLCETSRRYDPRGMFQWQATPPVPPALPPAPSAQSLLPAASGVGADSLCSCAFSIISPPQPPQKLSRVFVGLSGDVIEWFLPLWPFSSCSSHCLAASCRTCSSRWARRRRCSQSSSQPQSRRKTTVQETLMPATAPTVKRGGFAGEAAAATPGAVGCSSYSVGGEVIAGGSGRGDMVVVKNVDGTVAT